VEVPDHLFADGWKNTRQNDPEGGTPVPGMLE
jgi:hypothetical protein